MEKLYKEQLLYIETNKNQFVPVTRRWYPSGLITQSGGKILCQ